MLRKPEVSTNSPLRGGAITVREKASLKPGSFSMVQNLRPNRPGFKKRLGQRAMHTTADGTCRTMSIFQFKKTRYSGNQILVQQDDADVLAVTATIPGVITGVMGAELFDGTATGHIPASYSNLNDMLIYSNGSDQHQLYPGATSYVTGFVVVRDFSDSGDITALAVGVLDEGEDYSEEVSDPSDSGYAVVGAVATKANGGGIFICTPVPATSFTVDIKTANSNAAVMTMYYWKNDHTWADITETDNTASGGKSLAVDGTITWSAPALIQDRYMFGKVGYWYLLTFDAALAACEIYSITYTAAFSSLKNLWDGSPRPALKVLVETTAPSYDTYSSENVDLSLLAAAKKTYIASSDPIEGIYWDPGDTPNTTTSTDVTSLKYWDGDAWTTVGTTTDRSGGLARSGWMTFPRCPVKPRQFEESEFYAYWYELVWDAAISDDVIVTVDVMPYFDITDMGRRGQASEVWKERAVYSFADKFQEYLYISAPNAPQVINGDNSAILEMGDGRPHKIVAAAKFYNELMVWQEEKGSIGGTVTLVQGYSPATFGKLLLSSNVGALNAQSVVVVENVLTATETDESLKTVAFFLSRYGVCACDGKSIAVISDDIGNYFDGTAVSGGVSQCIAWAHADKMWLKYDPIDNVLRIGLVVGGVASVPNLFPVYDLVDRVWYFDNYAQPHGAFAVIEPIAATVTDADSVVSKPPYITIAGGTADGTLYHVGYGKADANITPASTAIDSYITIELPGVGAYINLLELILQCKSQSAGNITLTTYQNGIQKDSLTLSQTAEVTNQEIRRHVLSLNVQSNHVSVKIQNSSTTETMNLLTVGLKLGLWEKR